MDKVRLEFSKIDPSHYQPGAYVMELAEADGRRVLKIAIGIFEAHSISVFLEKLTPPTRPLTHDLFKNVFEEFGLELLDVVIYDLKEGIFFARLICSDGKSVHEIDSRTSDAIALAIRFNCPIYTHEFILSQAGIFREKDDFDKSESQSLDTPPPQQKELPASASESGESERKQRPRSSKSASDLASYSEEQLNETLNRALEDEAYELASKIRDELNKRKKNESDE